LKNTSLLVRLPAAIGHGLAFAATAEARAAVRGSATLAVQHRASIVALLALRRLALPALQREAQASAVFLVAATTYAGKRKHHQHQKATRSA